MAGSPATEHFLRFDLTSVRMSMTSTASFSKNWSHISLKRFSNTRKSRERSSRGKISKNLVEFYVTFMFLVAHYKSSLLFTLCEFRTAEDILFRGDSIRPFSIAADAAAASRAARSKSES
jgi:hypothetical protein